jgi:Arc/MetJ-type ribon-helix-helix transcriptional regulator
MTTLEISLPDNLKTFVEEQAAKSGHGSASDYLVALISELHRIHFGSWVETELEKGLDTGAPVEAGDEYWAQFRASYRQRLGRTAS